MQRQTRQINTFYSLIKHQNTMNQTINFKDNFILVRTENVERYRIEIAKIKVLPKDKLFELIQKAQKGNQTAMNQVITSNLRIVWSISKRYVNLGLDFEDLIQEGNIGLFQAVTTFDVNRGNEFSTWALEYVRKYITTAITEKGRVVRMNKKQLSNKKPYCHVCMDAPLTDEEGDKTILDTFSSDIHTDNFSEAEDMKHKIMCLMNGLTERERNIVCGLFGIGCEEETMYSLSLKYQICEERIRQIKFEAIEKMKKLV